MNNILLDANVILRFLAGDDEVQSPIAYKLFEKAVNQEYNLILSPVIIAECTWVLQTNRYGYAKKQIAERLTQLVLSPGIKTIEKDITLSSLKDYAEQNVDFIDAYLASLSSDNLNQPIVTWNKKDFKKLNCEFYLPEDIIKE